MTGTCESGEEPGEGREPEPVQPLLGVLGRRRVQQLLRVKEKKKRERQTPTTVLQGTREHQTLLTSEQPAESDPAARFGELSLHKHAREEERRHEVIWILFSLELH